MAENMELLKMCDTLIKPYDGNPSSLNAFLTSVELIRSCSWFCHRDETFVRFVRTRLLDRAAEAVPENCKSIAEIVTALKLNIRREDPDLLLGKMLNLRVKDGDLVAFAEKLEDLSQKLIESLIAEGVAKSKAMEFTVSYTVKICRPATSSTNARHSLASNTFKTPRDVIALMLLETSKEFSSYFKC